MDSFEVIEVERDGGTRWAIKWTAGRSVHELIQRDFTSREEAERWAERLASLDG